MLSQLDTIIGFAVVMALVSLLVTIITQMVSSFFGLRGRSLADALVVTLYKIDSKFAEENKDTYFSLIEYVLTHPTISDSVLPMKRPVLFLWRWNPRWWQWLVLQWKRAAAIRCDEMLALLEELAGTKAAHAKEQIKAADDGLQIKEQALKQVIEDAEKKNLNKEQKKAAEETKKQAKEACKEAQLKRVALHILDQLYSVTQERQTGLAALQAALPKLAAEKGADAVKEFTAATNHALNNLEKWFDSAQDRAQQWFTMHARVVTIIASIILAFLLQLDAMALLKQVSSDKQLRDDLVKTATQGCLLSTGAEVFTNGTTPTTNSVLYQQQFTVWTNALNSVIKTSGQDGLQLLPSPYPIQVASWKWYCVPTFKLIAPWSWPKGHLLGIIISAALLSLGAPFWFNTLKSLVNLRSSLADQIDEKPKQ